MKSSFTLALALLAGSWAGAQTPGTVTIDTSAKGAPVAESMYGIFFEEINHSGDGGLYAELIQNRGFEEHVIPSGCTYEDGIVYAPQGVVGWNDNRVHNWSMPWDLYTKKYTAWSLANEGTLLTYDVIEMEQPLDPATPNAMRLTIEYAQEGSRVQLINEGYWGIAYKDGDNYKLRFYMRSADYDGQAIAMLCDKDGTCIGKAEFAVEPNGQWTEYKATIEAGKTVSDGNFRLQFSGNGTIDVDYVSLFPEKTFRGRENGLRLDIAEALEALSPKFLRWPGGCIVEGITLENRVKWKETLGDPMTRRGEYDSWGYRCTWGLGYHEALLFAEDLGMDFMFVGNLGMACAGRNADFVKTKEDLDPYIADIRDAIEYAIGDPATNPWAKLRADAGHPEPFSLKYVELGNENWTVHYASLFNWAYDELKAEYPDLVFINTIAHYDEGLRDCPKLDMPDSHWYQTPEWFYSTSTFDFDNVDRNAIDYTIYVGEYACNEQVGSGNLDAALSESVFMNNMERNGDIVTMTSYAPLISNQNRPDWACNLIWVNSDQCVGRASYWAQQLYANNRPDYNVRSKVATANRAPYAGRIALGTFETTAEFRNVRCTSPIDGRVLYEDDLSTETGDWSNAARGNWVYEDGVLKQTNLDQSTYFTMDRLSFNDVVFEVECKKTGGKEGFLINLGCNDNDINHSWRFNIGGWGNAGTNLEEADGYWGPQVGTYVPMRLENDRWYRVKMVGSEGTIRCYIDDELIEEFCPTGTSGNTDVKSGRINMAAGYDQAAGEVVVKVVNANKEPLATTVTLNADNIQPTGLATVLGNAPLYWENSFFDPELIAPQTSEFDGFAREFEYTFLPNSLTIFRIKADQASAPIEFPGEDYTDEPCEIRGEILSDLDQATARLQRLIDRASYGAGIAGIFGADALGKAIESAKAVAAAADRTIESLNAEWDALCVELEAFYRANIDTEYEATALIPNADFSSGTQLGWRGSSITVNYDVAEYYNGAFGVYTEVEGLANGYYLLTVQGFYRHGINPWNEGHFDNLLAKLSANGESVPLRGLYSNDSFDWSMAGAQELFSRDQFSSINYLLCRVDDGTLTIDITKEQTEDRDWTCWDNFRLYAVGTDAKASVESVLAEPAETDANAPVYDVAGRRVGRISDLNTLAPGIYVSAGKKFVVR